MVQVVSMDGEGRGAHDSRMIGEAIQRELTIAGLGFTDLAERLGKDVSSVSRLVRGEIKEPSLEQILAVERALNLRSGWILRSAGVIEPDHGLTVRDHIATDPTLTVDELRLVLRIYDGAVTASSEERSRSADHKSPAARRTRRN